MSLKRLLDILNLLFALMGVVSIPLALTSFMLFDAPGSENNTYLWFAFWAALALPFLTFGSLLASMSICSKSQNYKKALWILLIPTMDIFIIVGSMTLIDIYCHGSFSC
jgi:hypothetical protein